MSNHLLAILLLLLFFLLSVVLNSLHISIYFYIRYMLRQHIPHLNIILFKLCIQFFFMFQQFNSLLTTDDFLFMNNDSDYIFRYDLNCEHTSRNEWEK